MRNGTTVSTLRMTSAPVLVTLVLMLLLLLYCVNSGLLMANAQTKVGDDSSSQARTTESSPVLSATQPVLSVQYHGASTFSR